MEQEEEENIIIELNSRFKEMRTLMITIASILAILMPVVNQMGIVNFGVDILVGELEDDNPFEVCPEDWRVIDSSYVIESEIILGFRVTDLSLCGISHDVILSMKVNSLTNSSDVGNEIYYDTLRNTKAWSFDPYIVEDGNWYFLISMYSNTTEKELVSSTRIFTVETSQEERKIYGCIDSDAMNYNEDATDSDGTCEYPEVVEDNCTANIYDVFVYWSDNNTSIYSDFDIDYTCEAYGNVTMELEIRTLDNQTVLLTSTLQYDTYYYDVDYQNIDFYNVTLEYSDYLAHFKLKTEDIYTDEIMVDLLRE
tara:strand:+ start:1410 stop:2339 length:930 start_codon:yes stop_codon:yes gene_type:complete